MSIISKDGFNLVIRRTKRERYVIIYGDSIDQAHLAHAIAMGWAEDRRLRFNWEDKVAVSKDISSHYIKQRQARDDQCKGK